jgi:Mg2+-importing ATPase
MIFLKVEFSVASAWLPYQPMLPIQLLTQNLLYDFSQGSIPWWVL